MRGILLCVLLFVSGCAGMVRANDGQHVTIEHDFFISKKAVHAKAVQACKQNGKQTAEFLHSANANPALKKGFGVQLSTFECR